MQERWEYVPLTIISLLEYVEEKDCQTTKNSSTSIKLYIPCSNVQGVHTLSFFHLPSSNRRLHTKSKSLLLQYFIMTETNNSSTSCAAVATENENEKEPEEEEVVEEEEVRWTDEEIRFGDRVEKPVDNDENEEEAFFDPFKDPDPFDTFSLQFPYQSMKHSNNNTEENVLDIELRGYKMDLDEIYYSTGLTLWRASEHLCHYLVQHPELITAFHKDNNNNPNSHSKRILELGACKINDGVLPR